MTGLGDEATLAAAWDAGCHGVVTKDRAAQDLVEGIRALASGVALTEPEPSAPRPGRKLPTEGGLSSREREVLTHLAAGQRPRIIADARSANDGAQPSSASCEAGAHSRSKPSRWESKQASRPLLQIAARSKPLVSERRRRCTCIISFRLADADIGHGSTPAATGRGCSLIGNHHDPIETVVLVEAPARIACCPRLCWLRRWRSCRDRDACRRGGATNVTWSVSTTRSATNVTYAIVQDGDHGHDQDDHLRWSRVPVSRARLRSPGTGIGAGTVARSGQTIIT